MAGDKVFFEISIYCKNLKDRDFFSKSDPVCQVSLQRLDNNEEWIDFGTTETIKNELNPIFVTKILVGEGVWEESPDREIRFTLWDIDYPNTEKKLEKNDFLGLAKFSICELEDKMDDNTKELCLQDGKSKTSGTISISVDKIHQSDKRMRLQLGANLLKEGESKKNDFYFHIYKKCERSDAKILVYKSEKIVIGENDDPLWETVEIPLSSLCNSDKDRVLIFEFFPTQAYCKTSVNDLMEKKDKHRGNIKLQAHDDKSIPWAFMAITNFYVDK